jgi:LPS-assembly protein
MFSMQINAWKGVTHVPKQSLTVFLDTIPSKVVKNRNLKSLDSLKREVNKQVDTSNREQDSTTIAKIDTLSISKDSLDAPVKYTAKDSGVLIIPTKEFILYGKSNTQYKDMTLDADIIRFDQATQTIKAYGTLDTTNNPLNKPKMKQGEMTSISDSIAFNMKSMRGRSTNTYYNEGELFVNARVLKKVGPNVFYGSDALFTTCNLDTPHFAIHTRKLKMISGKMAVSGPAYPEFEGVPIPIGIPFGIYPLQRGRHSGILAPAFTTSDSYGFGLEGLGYYEVVNDNLDVTVRSNLYTYGGWSLNINPRYLKRYHYTGTFNLTIVNNKLLNEVGTSPEEFTTSKQYSISWNHSRDSRARPGTSFNASVNYTSSGYNKSLLNNSTQNFNNNISSSVSYTKDFRGKSNLSVSLNHSQNSVTKLYNVNLPTVSYNVVTIYPFQKKDQIGTPKWWESFGIGYSGNFQNQFSFYDTAFNFKRLLDTIQWGVTHSIPITFTLPQLGPVTLSPSVSYSEHWLAQKIIRSWDSVKNKIDTNLTKGLFTTRQVSFGFSASTRIFGTYSLKHAKIRHEVRPTIGFSYSPDMSSKYYYKIQVDTFKNKLPFSQFDGVIPGGFSPGSSGNINFGIDNLLEMKIKDKKDTSASAYKKIKLLDGFGISSSYNLLADTSQFPLSPFNIYARSTLFEKVNITSSAILNPYEVNKYGYPIRRLQWQDGGLGTITSANIAISTSFKSKPKDGKSDSSRIPVDPFMTPDEQQRQLQFARANPAEFTDFNIPWSLNLSYSLNYSNTVSPDSSGAYSYRKTIYSSVNFSGDFSLTDKWKMGGNGYFDFSTGKLQSFSMFITREMHCWQLAINLTPIGLYRSFSITLNPKSGILRDLRINRARTFSNY